MKILRVYLENFASYKTLDFSFDVSSLALIHGATGSGKSTLMDAIPWLLFGITAKGGKADEILSWQGGPTFGIIQLEVNGLAMSVTRSRKPNDLYFQINRDPATRGKDLQDTQKIINTKIGMNADLYLAGAYFHEFSQTAQFFTTTAKNRRDITEQLVDLSLPISLQDKIKNQLKTIESGTSKLETTISNTSNKIQTLTQVLTDTQNKNDTWAHDFTNKISLLQQKVDSFYITKAHKIKDLETQVNIQADKVNQEKLKTPKTVKCKSCGAVSKNIKRLEAEAELQKLSILQERLEQVQTQENIYQTQVLDLKAQTNPYTTTLVKLSKDIEILNDKLDSSNIVYFNLKEEELNLELLSGIVITFRSELVKNTIESLEQATNDLLYNHFDGEIKINFTITDTDKLDVIITKDSNEASFTQLSKGQRQILKLCFGIAVMKTIISKHALSFNQIFFDEALDGLDDINKLKAVKMLETLSLDYDSIYLVEHSETIKAMIDNKYYVELIDGRSTIS